jgi:hypothetical protein
MNYDATNQERTIQAMIHDHHLGILHRVQEQIFRHPEVQAASTQAQAAGVPWIKIITTVLPFVLQILAGGKIDWQAIIAAILALINPAPIPLHSPANAA